MPTNISKPRWVRIDVLLIAEIEEAVWMDQMPSASVIAPLMARYEAVEDRAMACDFTGESERDVDAAADEALSEANSPSGWLSITETHAVQQLRGWSRLRYGTVMVPRERLTDVRRLLGDLSQALDNECDQGLAGARHDPDLYRQVEALVQETGYCGECHWCWVTRLRDEVSEILTPPERGGQVVQLPD